MDADEYRAGINAAIKTWPWRDRPLVRIAVWLIERREGAPDKPIRKAEKRR